MALLFSNAVDVVDSKLALPAMSYRKSSVLVNIITEDHGESSQTMSLMMIEPTTSLVKGLHSHLYVLFTSFVLSVTKRVTSTVENEHLFNMLIQHFINKNKILFWK